MDRVFGWLRDGVVTAALIVQQSAISLRYNWGIALLSVALAVSLWIYVTDRDDPERIGRVPGSMPVECVNVPPGKAESPPCNETMSVTVRVRAPQSVFEGLTADDFLATADLSGVTSDEATVLVRVESSEPRAEIVDISPARVTVRLENVTSRSVPVRTQLVGTPPRGFEVQEFSVDPEEAVVTGPESLVNRVAAVEADVNLTGARTNFEQRLLLQARDELGGNIQGVNVEPETALVQVALARLEFSAVFLVLPDVSGTPAPGFIATAIQVDPPFVVISGTSEVFQTLDPSEGVRTEAVPIDDARTDVQRTVALRLPPGARVERSEVTVRVIIEPFRLGMESAAPAGER